MCEGRGARVKSARAARMKKGAGIARALFASCFAAP
jgi:hypothetical protein